MVGIILPMYVLGFFAALFGPLALAMSGFAIGAAAAMWAFWKNSHWDSSPIPQRRLDE